MSSLVINNPDRKASDHIGGQFCEDFCREGSQPKYIFGRNIYAKSVAEHISVDGFIDDYATEQEYLGRPIVKLDAVPRDALVLNVAGGRPLSAKQRLDEAGLRNIDYFSFFRLSGLALREMRFNEGFAEEFTAHADEYAWIYNLLSDEASRETFKKLVSFRFEYDIAHLNGFTWREDVQYFEDFLQLGSMDESFVDVGCFNGFTSLEFIKRAPSYRSIHVFEPEPDNYQNCRDSLQDHSNVHFHNVGLSNRKATLKLEAQGSGSRVSETGSLSIDVDRLDDVINDSPTFIKMDIEGEESAAIEGAQNTIARHHPRLAVSVYHKPGDFWKIPKQILAIREDYDIYMRHYTECIYETVMFFLPKR